MYRWSKKEIELLKENYPKESRREILPLFPERNWRSIRYKAKKLGLNIGHRRNDYWKEEETSFIRNNYINMTDKEIGDKFGRSTASIQTRRKELKLFKHKHSDFLTPSLLILSEVEKAYLSGLLDGDGSISLHKCNKYGKHGINPRISFAVSITSANKEFTEQINKMIGGVVKRRSNVHYETTVQRQVDVLYLLKNLLPYLRLKKKNAYIMIEYCEDRLKLRKLYNRTNVPLSEKCFDLVKKMKNLNKVKMEDRIWM